MVGCDDGLMGGQFSSKSRSTDMRALPAVAIIATVMLPFMFCQSLQQVCTSRNGSAACSVVPVVCMYAFVYTCIDVYDYTLCVYIYMRNYAHMTRSITY